MYVNKKGQEVVKFFDPKVGGYRFLEKNRRDNLLRDSRKPLFKLWKVPGPMDEDNVQLWASDNLYNFRWEEHIETIKIELSEYEDVEFTVKIRCVIQRLYDKNYLHYLWPEVLKINGKDYGTHSSHKGILRDPYSYPEDISEDIYNSALEDSLIREFGFISAIDR